MLAARTTFAQGQKKSRADTLTQTCPPDDARAEALIAHVSLEQHQELFTLLRCSRLAGNRRARKPLAADGRAVETCLPTTVDTAVLRCPVTCTLLPTRHSDAVPQSASRALSHEGRG